MAQMNAIHNVAFHRRPSQYPNDIE